MKLIIRQSFEKDSTKLPAHLQNKVASIIADIEDAKRLSDLNSCKKLIGFKNAYRIRLGSYRVGFFFEDGIVELVRILNRKSIYRHFP